MILNAFLGTVYNVYYFHLSCRPTSGGVVTLKTGRRGVPGSNPVALVDLAVRGFSVVFSEICINTGQDSLERPPPSPHGGHFIYKSRSHKRTFGLKTYYKRTTIFSWRRVFYVQLCLALDMYYFGFGNFRGVQQKLLLPKLRTSARIKIK